METSLVKTLAHKLKTSVRKVYRKYRTTKTINGKSYSVLLATVETDGKTYEYFWGGIPLNVESVGKTFIEDRILPQYSSQQQTSFNGWRQGHVSTVAHENR